MGRLQHLRASGLRRPAEVLVLGLAVFLLASLAIGLTRGEGRVAVVWPVNAVILIAVLRRPIRLWPAYLLGALGGNVSANLWSGDPVGQAVGLALCNTAEVVACGLWLRNFAGRRLDLSGARHLGHFILAAGVIGPAASTVPASLLLAWPMDPVGLRQALAWYASDALGLLVIVPIWALLARAGWRGMVADVASWRGGAVALAIAAALLIIAIDPATPVYFLIPPALVFAGFMLEPAGVAVALAAVATVMIGSAALGMGAAADLPGGLAARLFHGQALLGVTTLSGLLVSAAVTARRRTEEMLKANILELAAARAVAERNEARYRQVAEHASDVIARTSLNGEGLYLSPSVEEVTGYRAEELLASQPPFAALIHPDDLPGALAYYRDLVKSDAPVAGAPLQYRLRRRDGRWIWLESNASILRDARGRAAEFVDVVRDVTAHVELERAMLAAQHAAEEATAVKARFIANMSHEIRTPLMAVLGFADALAKRADLPVDALRRIAQIQGAGRGLLAIANDVLDFSRLEAGAFRIRPQPCDATELLVDTIAIFEAQAEAKGLQLELSVSGLPDRLLLDGDRVRQILNNYVGNAIKFTDEGRVTVRARYDSPVLHLEVDDTGHGLTPDEQSRLFIRFSQVDGGQAARSGGTGLGLAICKGLAEAMGGRVGVRSERGRGSTFFAEIPAEVVPAELFRLPPPARSVREPAAPAVRLGGRRRPR